MKSLTSANIIHVMDKNNIPAITIMPGETIAVETAKPGIPDEVFLKDYSKEPYPKRILSITGPIQISGAEPGDTLRIAVQKIELDVLGKMWTGQWMGILHQEMDHCYLKKVKVEEGLVHFSDDIQLPVKPMIGTIGVAPSGDAVACLDMGRHGGNMDAPCIREGSVLYLPVQVSGGLLSMGDVHATMGLGEVFGTGVEIGSTVVVQIDVIQKKLDWPVVETEQEFHVLVSGSELLETCKEATRSAIRFLMQNTTLGFDDAYAFVGQACDLKILQVVNPSSSVSISIPKKFVTGFSS